MFDNTQSRGRSRIAAASFALLATGSLILSGCATGPSGDNADADGYRIVMILGVSGDEGYLTDACGAQAVANENSVTLEVQAANRFDPAAQVPVLQAAIATQPDAILIAPTDTTALIAPIQQAVAAGIKVVLFDTTLDDLTGIESVVGVDNAAGGALAADAMNELIGGEGKVLVSNLNPGVSTTDARQSGFEAQIATFPGIDYVGPQYNNNDTSKAAAIVSATLTAHPDLAGIFGTNLTAVEGSVTGLRNADALGSVKVVGFDATPAEVEALEAGYVQALIAQKLRDMGATAMQVAVDVLDGKSVDPEYKVGFQVITKDNLDTQESQDALYVAECNL